MMIERYGQTIKDNYELMMTLDVAKIHLPHNAAFYALTPIHGFIIAPTWCIALAKRLSDVLPISVVAAALAG